MGSGGGGVRFDNGGGELYIGGSRGLREIAITSSQFCYEPKTALENKVC